jgi:sugar phosphate isomerase/epimerase
MHWTRITVSITLCFILSYSLMAQEIGLELYSLRNQLKTDVPGTLAKIKSWNIHELEGGGTYGLPMEEYKKLLQQNGLNMISVGADFDALSKDPQPAIDEAKAFGAKYIVCFWIPHNGDDFTIDNMKKATDVFNAAGKKIRDAGLSSDRMKTALCSTILLSKPIQII